MALHSSIKLNRSDPRDSLRPRLLFVMLFFCVTFGGLGYRAFELQVKRRDAFHEMIRDSQFTTIRMPAKRGDVYDRNMAPMAISVDVDSICANPRMINDRERVARHLAKSLRLSARQLLLHLAQDRYFVWIKRHVTRKEVNKVKRLGFRGIRIVQESRRFYPNHRLASHILGYTDRDGKGLAGVERHFDRLLRGKKQSIRLARDPKGRQILHPGLLSRKSRWGSNVVLTIDKSIQYIAEREIAKAVKKWKAKRGIAVVMDPTNGDLLALAIAPDFDPNHFRDFPSSIRNNAAISNPYEPGSTLKILTLAVARDLNLFDWFEKMDCENGRMKVGRYTIRDDHPHRWLTPPEVLKYSSNICTAKLAKRIGKERLFRYFQKFGIGQKTDLGLPWESRGIFHSWQKWADISLANIAFGQGVSVTPIQLTAAISAVANGGRYFQPRLYKKILDRTGQVLETFDPHPLRRVLNVQSASDTLRMMELVVQTKGGTGRNASIKGVRVAGKTGTAQKPRENGRGYGRKRIGSFVGVVPADHPKLTILVVIDEPQGGKYGGVVAAPTWKQIALGSMKQMGVMLGDRIRFQSLAIPEEPFEEERKKKIVRRIPSPRPIKIATKLSKNALMRRIPSPRPTKSIKSSLKNQRNQKVLSLRFRKKAKPKLPRSKPRRSLHKVAKRRKKDNAKKRLISMKPKQNRGKASPPTPRSSPRSATPRFIGLTLSKARKKARQAGVFLRTLGRGLARYQRPSAGTNMPRDRRITLVFTQ